jgi:hypothetical protein
MRVHGYVGQQLVPPRIVEHIVDEGVDLIVTDARPG